MIECSHPYFLGVVILREDFQENSRSGNRAKRKKTNYILNGLIVIVLLLIAFVAYSIFFSGNDHAAPKKKIQTSVPKQENASGKTAVENKQTNSSQTNDQQSGGTNPQATPDQSKAVVTDGGNTSDVKQTTKNPNWKSVGTSQTGQHTTVYDSSSADWQEMLKAISSATGLDQKNMTVWFLGRDNSTTNGSIGTVSAKNSKQKYRVYIKWVDGGGWKPTKVEQLK